MEKFVHGGKCEAVSATRPTATDESKRQTILQLLAEEERAIMRREPTHSAVATPRMMGLFQGLQVREKIIDLIRFELKGWHRRMPSVNAFGECLCESFNRIAKMQFSKWGRDFERTGCHPVDGVAL